MTLIVVLSTPLLDLVIAMAFMCGSYSSLVQCEPTDEIRPLHVLTGEPGQ